MHASPAGAIAAPFHMRGLRIIKFTSFISDPGNPVLNAYDSSGTTTESWPNAAMCCSLIQHPWSET